MRTEAWILKNTESLAGKTVALTGSTGGLGRALAAHLARLGASLILLDRNAKRSEAHKAQLTERYGVSVECIPLDALEFSSVKRATDALLCRPLDILIHNAGAYDIPRSTTEWGYDNVFTINFISPYYMTRRLLPLLRERGGHTVVVGSIAHRYSKTDPKDVDFSTRARASHVYGNAKRHLMYALHELFREEREATLSITHPGISFTGITDHYPPLLFALIKYPMKVIFMKPARASLSILRGVFEKTEAYDWIGPRIFDVWGIPSKKRLRHAGAEEIQHIFGVAEEIFARLDT